MHEKPGALLWPSTLALFLYFCDLFRLLPTVILFECTPGCLTEDDGESESNNREKGQTPYQRVVATVQGYGYDTLTADGLCTSLLLSPAARERVFVISVKEDSSRCSAEPLRCAGWEFAQATGSKK